MLLCLFVASFNYNRLNHVAAYDFIDNVHSPYNATKYRVSAIEMRLRRVCHEPLRTASVLAGECHADCRAIVKCLVDLATDRISRPAVAIAARVTTLNHKVWHNSMKRDVAKIPALGKLNEVINCQWGRFGEKLHSKRTLAGSHYGTNISADPRQRAFVVCFCVSCLYRSDFGAEITGAVGFQQSSRTLANEIVVGFETCFYLLVCCGCLLFCERAENCESGIVRGGVHRLRPRGGKCASVFFRRRKIAENTCGGLLNRYVTFLEMCLRHSSEVLR